MTVLAGMGNLLMSWSFIERQLGTLICQYHHVAPDKIKRRGLPTALADKIRYVAAIAEDPRIPEDIRLALKGWLPEIGRLRHHRDLIVHGNLSQVGRSLRWRAQILTLRGGAPTFEDRYFTHDELVGKQREIHELSHRMAQVLTPVLLEVPAGGWQPGS